MRIVLASASPRRKELLASAGIDAEIVPSNADEESVSGASAEQTALIRSYVKAAAVADLLTGDKDFVVIGADTLVEKDGIIYGKPVDCKEAEEMLKSLCGDSHNVYTGVTLAFSDGRKKSFVERSVVAFAPYDKRIITNYISNGKYVGKAGGYGIQDEEIGLIAKVTDGEADNVIGLPVKTILKLLEGEIAWQPWK